MHRKRVETLSLSPTKPLVAHCDNVLNAANRGGLDIVWRVYPRAFVHHHSVRVAHALLLQQLDKDKRQNEGYIVEHPYQQGRAPHHLQHPQQSQEAALPVVTVVA